MMNVTGFTDHRGLSKKKPRTGPITAGKLFQRPTVKPPDHFLAAVTLGGNDGSRLSEQGLSRGQNCVGIAALAPPENSSGELFI
jgi:hypothetical protein